MIGESRLLLAARRLASFLAWGILALLLLGVYAVVAVGVLWSLEDPAAFEIALWGFILGPLVIVAAALLFRYRRRG